MTGRRATRAPCQNGGIDQGEEGFRHLDPKVEGVKVLVVNVVLSEKRGRENAAEACVNEVLACLYSTMLSGFSSIRIHEHSMHLEVFRLRIRNLHVGDTLSGSRATVVLLFGDARTVIWEKKFSLSVFLASQMLKTGMSVDYDICNGKWKNGMACAIVINSLLKTGIYEMQLSFSRGNLYRRSLCRKVKLE
ncbi:hypothetical protein ZIOFF_003333 [Zingiber officinale]|uniref:Uncharacterized protein n=1 Tax=Zingiber officinale TaxID=94328 RepID=A0A8J5I6C0_ZINOF|nr:hypothetical protein ZIOFF_003333 [Zingiber officinale]